MNDLRTAAQQALEALEEFCELQTMLRPGEKRDALRAALAEPVQEPFALPCPTPKACKAHCCSGNCIPRTAPPQRPPLTEEEIRDLWSWAMTAEAERTATTQQHAFARAIERAHGIGGEA